MLELVQLITDLGLGGVGTGCKGSEEAGSDGDEAQSECEGTKATTGPRRKLVSAGGGTKTGGGT